MQNIWVTESLEVEFQILSTPSNNLDSCIFWYVQAPWFYFVLLKVNAKKTHEHSKQCGIIIMFSIYQFIFVFFYWNVEAEVILFA